MKRKRCLSWLIMLAIIFTMNVPATASAATLTVASGVESITVSNYTIGATLKLFLSNGTLMDTADNVATSSYSFASVIPNSMGYYVTETVGSVEVAGSAIINSIMKTPAVSAGIGYVEVTNVCTGAAIELYNLDGSLYSSSPSLISAGVYHFTGLTAGNSYYVVQSINGVISGGSSIVTVSAYIPSAPTLTSGEEELQVAGYDIGATLKLYWNDGTLVTTVNNVNTVTYTFENVVPRSTGYYVTQTVGTAESVNSSILSPALRTPSAAPGVGYVEVSDVYTGATITLYGSVGNEISHTPNDEGGGIYRFTGLTGGSTYYVIQSINGVVSLNSSFVVVLTNVPTAPTVSSGEMKIEVSDFILGSTLKLYLANGTLKATATNVNTTTYTFQDVIPNSSSYYVSQTVGSSEGTNSNFVNSSLGTPSINTGIGYARASNVCTGAAIELYNLSNVLISDIPTDEGSGVYLFSGLTVGQTYYVIQRINGTVSEATSWFTIPAYIPSAPVISAGEEELQVEDFDSGATLKLYLTTGSLIATATNITSNSYTFPNVVPNSLEYYVTQTVGSIESQNSSFLSPSLRTPLASGGFGYVQVSNIYTDASVKLYDLEGTLISDTLTEQGGYHRFLGLTGGTTFYVVQSINGVTSSASGIVTVQTNYPAAPLATVGEEEIMVSNFVSGATLKLYLTNGTLVNTAVGVNTSTYLFDNTVPNSLGYYVTQTVDSIESVNSSFINSTLRTPVASAGIQYVDVSNIYPGATVKLYYMDGTLVSDTPVSQGGGTYRFSGLIAGNQYYVVQSINNVVSLAYNIVITESSPSNNTTNSSNKSRYASITTGADSNSTIMSTVEVVREIVGDINIDTVLMDTVKAEEVIEQALNNKQDTIQIFISDLADNPADEVAVTISKNAISQFSEADISIEIKTNDVTIKLSKETLKDLSEDNKDLYFRVVPVKNDADKEATIDNVMKSEIILNAAGNNEVVVIGIPMTIETNYTGHKTKVIFPLNGITIPTDSAQKQAFLDNLAVFIQHSDGEKVVKRGIIQYDSKGEPIGIEIEIDKFSTFTILSIANVAPKAANLTISGSAKIGKKLTAQYSYSDFDMDKEGKSIYKWYRADDAKGTNKKLISGAEGLTYTVKKADQGKYIIIEITPIAATGDKKGKTIKKALKIVKADKTPASPTKQQEIKYTVQLKLGIVGSKTYAHQLATIIKDIYKGKNVTVKKEGKYYRVTGFFLNKSEAAKTASEMKEDKYIINYEIVK